MKARTRLPGWTVAVGVCATLMVACGGTGRVDGTVSARGVAVPTFITLRLENADGVSRTIRPGDNGYYLFTDIPAGDYRLEASVPECVPETRAVTVEAEETTHVAPIALQREE